MFQNLRTSSNFFVLHKDNNPYVEIGSVVSVSQPMPKYPTPPVFGQPQEMVVDVVVRMKDNSNLTFQKLPATLDIADFGMNGNMVVATSKEAMNSEINSLRQKSIDIVNSCDFHKGLMVAYDTILKDLNPEYAEKQQRDEEMTMMKSQMQNMTAMMSQLMEANKELMSQLSAEKNGSKKKETSKNE